MSYELQWIIWAIIVAITNLGTWFISQRIFIRRVSKGVQILLKIELERISNRCHKKGYATIEEKNQYENIYNIYISLGKDGVMDINRKQFMELPNKK